MNISKAKLSKNPITRVKEGLDRRQLKRVTDNVRGYKDRDNKAGSMPNSVRTSNNLTTGETKSATYTHTPSDNASARRQGTKAYNSSRRISNSPAHADGSYQNARDKALKESGTAGLDRLTSATGGIVKAVWEAFGMDVEKANMEQRWGQPSSADKPNTQARKKGLIRGVSEKAGDAAKKSSPKPHQVESDPISGQDDEEFQQKELLEILVEKGVGDIARGVGRAAESAVGGVKNVGRAFKEGAKKPKINDEGRITNLSSAEAAKRYPPIPMSEKQRQSKQKKWDGLGSNFAARKKAYEEMDSQSQNEFKQKEFDMNDALMVQKGLNALLEDGYDDYMLIKGDILDNDLDLAFDTFEDFELRLEDFENGWYDPDIEKIIGVGGRKAGTWNPFSSQAQDNRAQGREDKETARGEREKIKQGKQSRVRRQNNEDSSSRERVKAGVDESQFKGASKKNKGASRESEAYDVKSGDKRKTYKGGDLSDRDTFAGALARRVVDAKNKASKLKPSDPRRAIGKRVGQGKDAAADAAKAAASAAGSAAADAGSAAASGARKAGSTAAGVGAGVGRVGAAAGKGIVGAASETAKNTKAAYTDKPRTSSSTNVTPASRPGSIANQGGVAGAGNKDKTHSGGYLGKADLDAIWKAFEEAGFDVSKEQPKNGSTKPGIVDKVAAKYEGARNANSRMDDLAAASRSSRLASASIGAKRSDAASRVDDVADAHRAATLAAKQRRGEGLG